MTTKIYSRGEFSAPPSTDDDLTSSFTEADYTAVSIDDNNKVSQLSTDKYSIFLFKNKHTEKNRIYVNCTIRSDRAPSISPVYLQIFNRTTQLWETLDSNSSESSNTDFTLTGTITTNLSSYFDNEYWISCRIYQRAI